MKVSTAVSIAVLAALVSFGTAILVVRGDVSTRHYEPEPKLICIEGDAYYKLGDGIAPKLDGMGLPCDCEEGESEKDTVKETVDQSQQK